jgi:DNA-binding transcriptional regulator LsrR (DeoR family)
MKAKVSAGRKGQLLGETHHQYRHDISTEAILQRLSEGATKAQIALELGVAHTFVHRRVKQARSAGQVIPKVKRNLPKRGPFNAEHRAKLSAARKGRFGGAKHPGWKDVPMQEVLARMAQGIGQQEIAKEFGVSTMTIRRKLRQQRTVA